MDWRLSPELREFVSELLQSHGPEELGTKYVPSVIWSLGSTIDRGDGKPQTMPAPYTLGWIKKEDLTRFVAIQDEKIGVIAFGPKTEDTAALAKVLTISDGLIHAT